MGPGCDTSLLKQNEAASHKEALQQPLGPTRVTEQRLPVPRPQLHVHLRMTRAYSGFEPSKLYLSCIRALTTALWVTAFVPGPVAAVAHVCVVLPVWVC